MFKIYEWFNKLPFFRRIFDTLLGFVKRILTSTLGRIIFSPIILIAGLIKWIFGFIAGGAQMLFLVWKATAAYFFVHLIRRFILFPIYAFTAYVILGWIWNGYTFSFLDNLSINAYLVNMIQSNEFLLMAAVAGYDFGIWQALTIYFNFVILTFVMRLFIKTFMRD